MKTYPRSRAMGETVREIIARLLLQECADPRLDLVTVTGVDMSPDMTHANIFVTVHGDEARIADAMAGLQAAKGRLRTMLGEAIRLRYVPELHFRIDLSIDEATRINDAILRERASGRVGPDEPAAESDADES
ncbi:MAG TPA: 30S ribosome-binding factor RbfA [Coriobacteriia bacterium]